MHITDPIADMLTRIRNANNQRHATVDVPASNMKKAIAKILLDEGYVKNVEYIEDGTQGVIRITLKYAENKQKDIFCSCSRDYPVEDVYRCQKDKQEYGTAEYQNSSSLYSDVELDSGNCITAVVNPEFLAAIVVAYRA